MKYTYRDKIILKDINTDNEFYPNLLESAVKEGRNERE